MLQEVINQLTLASDENLKLQKELQDCRALRQAEKKEMRGLQERIQDLSEKAASGNDDEVMIARLRAQLEVAQGKLAHSSAVEEERFRDTAATAHLKRNWTFPSVWVLVPSAMVSVSGRGSSSTFTL